MFKSVGRKPLSGTTLATAGLSRAFGADLICTELAYENEVCTGKWIGKNMTGYAKREALEKYLQQHPEVSYSIALGDKKSDAISGALADEYHQNYFH